MKNLELVFKCFADKNRLRILKLLEKQNLCVCELAYVLGITQPSTSRHLKKLKEAEIIEGYKEGFWTNYYLKKDNQYAKFLLGRVKTWLNDEKTVQTDLKKLKTADRTKLCCRR